MLQLSPFFVYAVIPIYVCTFGICPPVFSGNVFVYFEVHEHVLEVGVVFGAVWTFFLLAVFRLVCVLLTCLAIPWLFGNLFPQFPPRHTHSSLSASQLTKFSRS